MSDAAPRHLKYLQGASIALAFFMGMAAQAEARGIVADGTTPATVYGSAPVSTSPLVTLSSPVCVLNGACNPISQSDLNNVLAGENLEANPPSPALSSFAFPTGTQGIYVYNDGIVTFGSALSGATEGSLAGLTGQNYIAAAFNNYSSETMSVLYEVRSSNELVLYWEFSPTTQTGKSALFGIDMFFQPDGSIHATADYGAAMFNWYKNGYCDAICQGGTDIADVGGDYELGGTAAGSSYGITSGDLTFPDAFSVTVPGARTSAVPEPSTWAMMAFGLLSLGLLSRRRRKRTQAPL